MECLVLAEATAWVHHPILGLAESRMMKGGECVRKPSKVIRPHRISVDTPAFLIPVLPVVFDMLQQEGIGVRTHVACDIACVDTADFCFHLIGCRPPRLLARLLPSSTSPCLNGIALQRRSQAPQLHTPLVHQRRYSFQDVLIGAAALRSHESTCPGAELLSHCTREESHYSLGSSAREGGLADDWE